MKIGIIGNYGATNVGDEAILSCILKNLEGHQITVFSARPEALPLGKKISQAPLFPLGFRSCLKYGFRASIQALKRVDVVILGGGGLFQDKRLYACFLWGWQIFWVKWLKKPLFIYATGVGSLTTGMGRFLTKRSYDYAKIITVRDSESADLLQAIGVKKEVKVVADPVFLNEKPEKIKSRTKNLFIISLRPWLFQNQKIIQVFESFLEDLKKERAPEFIFVCMQAEKEDDLQLIKPLIKKVGGKIYSPKSFSEFLKIMEKAEFAMGMRYHFMIAALITHTPLLPISYAPKTSSLFTGTPLENQVLLLENLEISLLKNHFRELSIAYNNNIVYEKALAKNHSDKAAEGLKILKDFLKTVDPHKTK